MLCWKPIGPIWKKTALGSSFGVWFQWVLNTVRILQVVDVLLLTSHSTAPDSLQRSTTAKPRYFLNFKASVPHLTNWGGVIYASLTFMIPVYVTTYAGPCKQNRHAHESEWTMDDRWQEVHFIAEVDTISGKRKRCNIKCFNKEWMGPYCKSDHGK